MSLQDKVNLTFWASEGTFVVITSRQQAIGFRDAWHEALSESKVAVSGNFNHADGNPIELEFKSDVIIGVQIMELNQF